MEWSYWVAGIVLLIIIFAMDSKGKKNDGKKYRRSDLLVGRDAGKSGYCVYCCSAGFEVVFRGSLEECERFMSDMTYE